MHFFLATVFCWDVFSVENIAVLFYRKILQILTNSIYFVVLGFLVIVDIYRDLIYKVNNSMEGQILHSKVDGKAPWVSLSPVVFYRYLGVTVIWMLSTHNLLVRTFWHGKPKEGLNLSLENDIYLCSGLNSSLERDKGHGRLSALNKQCGGTVGLLLCVWRLPTPCAGRAHSSPLGQQVGRTGQRQDVLNTPNFAPVMI